MKFLVIDDDDYKAEVAIKYLAKHETIRARSYISGMKTVLQGDFDGIILDMAFPLRDYGQIEQMDEGLNILREMKRCKLNVPVMCYSSNVFDVREFNNVVSYVRFSAMYDLSEPFKNFIKKCKIK